MNDPIDLPITERKFLPTLPRNEPRTKDSTAVKGFKKCPRYYFYRFVLGRTKPEGQWGSVFAFGSAVHKFLEVLYETGDVAHATQEGLKLFRSPTHKSFEFQTKERFIQTCVALFNKYNEEQSKKIVEVIAIEQPFVLKFPDGNDVGGRFDQIIKWNGRIWLRDWKTTSKQLQYWKKGLEPNDQAIRYIYGMSCLQFGQDAQGYPNKVIDGVLFTAIYNAKTVGPQIENVPSSRTLGQVKRWVDDQMYVHRMMDMCREADVWPQNEDSCSFCDFQEVCNQSTEAGMVNMLKTAYVHSPWKHEETDQKTLTEK